MHRSFCRWKRVVPPKRSMARIQKQPDEQIVKQPFFAPYFRLPGVPRYSANTATSAQTASSSEYKDTSADSFIIGFRGAHSGPGEVIYGQSCHGKARGIQVLRPVASLQWCYYIGRRNPKKLAWQALKAIWKLTIATYVLSFFYNRVFGTELVETVTEEQGMVFLCDPSNPVREIHVNAGRSEASVYLPHALTHNAEEAIHHFRFHISSLFGFEPSILHFTQDPKALGNAKATEDTPSTPEVAPATTPSDVETTTDEATITDKTAHSWRPVYFSYHVTFPWVPILLLSLVPLFSIIQSRFRFMRFNLMQKGGLFGQGPAEQHFSILAEKSKTKFTHIAGMAEPKQEVMEVVDFLLHPAKYQRMGASVPKGIMLSGPPGVGKTLLAKAVAGEANCNFIACTGSEFVEIFVGVGASRVRELMAMARKAAPCVVFIDEIDAFAKSRKMGEKSTGGGGQGEGDNTVNALLSELDGFHPTSGVVVIAGTNRVDVLDEALLRPGRFDRKIAVDSPTYLDRIEIFKLHLKPLKLEQSSAEGTHALACQLASRTPGNSGADIKNICNESAIIAARSKKAYVDMESMNKGLDRVQIGLKRQSKVLSDDERDRAAYHEAGHAVVNWSLAHADPICQVSIVQYTGKPMSHNQKLPSDKFIRIQAELDDRLCDLLGGLVAEDVFMKECTSSAAEDAHRATSFAYDYVTRYGMCPESIGHFSFPSNDDGVTIQKPYSSAVEKKIDAAVQDIIKRAKDRVREILVANEHAVRSVYGSLKKQERLSAVDLTNILGPRKVVSKEFSEYLTSK